MVTSAVIAMKLTSSFARNRARQGLCALLLYAMGAAGANAAPGPGVVLPALTDPANPDGANLVERNVQITEDIAATSERLRVSLVCSDRNITKIFEITGLDRVFPIHASRDDALAAVASAAE